MQSAHINTHREAKEVLNFMRTTKINVKKTHVMTQIL